MASIEITTDNFTATVTANPIVILDFWAGWCGPCRGFAPVFEAASEEHPDIVFGKIDTEAQQELAAAFNVRSIPTLMVFREQVILYSEAGALPGQAFTELIERVRAVDMAAVHAEIAAEEGQA
ncbi:MAG TPA: thioredoxin family protein [Rhodocyclaceae bacterium]|nr:thioredoxin family protein [Rhodocyclaceae bacterium]